MDRIETGKVIEGKRTASFQFIGRFGNAAFKMFFGLKAAARVLQMPR